MDTPYNLNLLVTFSVLTETHSFSECARRLRCSQPTVSRQIRDLEKQLGMQLFLRDRHQIELTREGQRLRRDVLPQLHEVLRRLEPVADPRAGVRGKLRFGSLSEVGKSTFMRLLLKFQKKHPALNLVVEYAEEQQIRDALRAGRLDFGVLSEAASLESIRGYKLFDERIGLLTRSSNEANPATDRRERIPFVIYHDDDSLFEQYRRRLPRKLAERIEVSVCVNSHRSMLDALEVSDSYAVMPLLSVRKALDGTRFRLVPGFELTKPLHLAHHDNPYASERDRVFRQFMIDECRALRG